MSGTAAAARSLLVLSDGKPGHLNQTLAFAGLLELAAEVRTVRFRGPGGKAASYLFDRAGIRSRALFRLDGALPPCCAVASAGSATYYATKVLAAHLRVPAVAIMLPRGYRYDFDLIVAQAHDRPPDKSNILALPVNLCRPQPQKLVQRLPGRPCVSVIVGGPSRHFRMDAAQLDRQLKQVFALFPQADFLATTSRRTPPEIERLVAAGPFRYKVIASREPVNPIADFLAISDYVFVTEDSTSMISEAVSFGAANVEILPLPATGRRNKVGRMLDELARRGCLHLFDGVPAACSEKLDLAAMLKGVRLCG